MKTIGITGRAGSGKDTAAEILVKARGYTRIAFADPIRRMVECLGIDCSTRATKETPVDWLGLSPRQLMQTLGTEWGRETVDENLWLLVMENQIEKARAAGAPGVVISDVRFDNEAWMIIDRGGQVWQITRDSAETVAQHVSENGVDSETIDVSLANNGTVDQLYDRVLEAEAAVEHDAVTA